MVTVKSAPSLKCANQIRARVAMGTVRAAMTNAPGLAAACVVMGWCVMGKRCAMMVLPMPVVAVMPTVRDQVAVPPVVMALSVTNLKPVMMVMRMPVVHAM